jgi:hypothetical protein
MSADASGIIPLRRLLSERFPGVRTWTENTPPCTQAARPSGLASLDATLQGGIPQGALTEIVASAASAGSALFLRHLLLQTHRSGRLMGLIDGRDSFDPCALPPIVLSRLFWVRCQTADQALKVADILLRDRNLPLIALDLKMNSNAELRKISGTAWYRLQRVAQQTATSFVVLTPFPLVPGAHARLLLDNAFTLDALTESAENLAAGLKFELVRSTAAEAAAG